LAAVPETPITQEERDAGWTQFEVEIERSELEHAQWLESEDLRAQADRQACYVYLSNDPADLCNGGFGKLAEKGEDASGGEDERSARRTAANSQGGINGGYREPAAPSSSLHKCQQKTQEEHDAEAPSPRSTTYADARRALGLATPDDRRHAQELLDDIYACFVPGGDLSLVVINGCNPVGALAAYELARRGVDVNTTDVEPGRADIPGCTNISPGTKLFQLNPRWYGQFIGQPRVLHGQTVNHVWTTLRRGPVLAFIHGDAAAYSPNSEPAWSIPETMREALRGESNGDFHYSILYATSVSNQLGTPVAQEERDAGWTQFDVDRARGYSRIHDNGWTLDEVEDALERYFW
jgi:hypothetical protein